MEKVCLVIGAGAGIGGTVAKRFAKEGYHAYLARRTDEEGLEKLITQISDDGGKASGSSAAFGGSRCKRRIDVPRFVEYPIRVEEVLVPG